MAWILSIMAMTCLTMGSAEQVRSPVRREVLPQHTAPKKAGNAALTEKSAPSKRTLQKSAAEVEKAKKERRLKRAMQWKAEANHIDDYDGPVKQGSLTETSK